MVTSMTSNWLVALLDRRVWPALQDGTMKGFKV
jgi:hypothetical protein